MPERSHLSGLHGAGRRQVMQGRETRPTPELPQAAALDISPPSEAALPPSPPPPRPVFRLGPFVFPLR